MTVWVASCSVEQLLTNSPIEVIDPQGAISTIEGKLTIPEYQRPYCWDKKQIMRLIKDCKFYQEKSHACFIGSIILHRKGERLNIIDGQQRLTSLALMGFLTEQYKGLSLNYKSLESQKQIQQNLYWLRQVKDDFSGINFNMLNVTLVITNDEDEAYRFFETQNTGGVRLEGPDIIKAHHLRAIPNQNNKQDDYAHLWEAMEKDAKTDSKNRSLHQVINILLRGRYWQAINPKDYPNDNNAELRDCIVEEFGEKTGQGDDIAYGIISRSYKYNTQHLHISDKSYELRQPLNSGENTINYFRYFYQLYQNHLVYNANKAKQNEFHRFYHERVKKLNGTHYLASLYNACLLLFIGRYGEQHLEIAAKKIFRVVYSLRISKRRVDERQVYNFAIERKSSVLEWIAQNFTVEQCLNQFDAFPLKADSEGILVAELSPTTQKSSTKQQFIDQIIKEFDLKVAKNVTKEDYVAEFCRQFTQAVVSLSIKA